MALITHEEIMKIARMSHIELTQEEIAKMQSHVEVVLSYAARVQDLSAVVVEGADDIVLFKNSNVERQDAVIEPMPEPILAQAPEREGNYFVVPVIIEATE